MPYVRQYPFIPDSTFNVTWSGDVTLDLWATAASVDGSANSTQAIYSPALSLHPFKEYSIVLTTISYEMNSFPWLFFEPRTCIICIEC